MDPVSKPETDSEDDLVEYVKDSEPPIIIDISSDADMESDNQKSSGFGCSNVIQSSDSKPPRMEMSKDSRSPHNGWKSLRINADWPSPSRGATTVIPHLPAPAEPVSTTETDSEDEPDELASSTSKDSQPPIIIDISSDTESDNQESSGVGCSNANQSNDSKPPRTMEMSKDSQSPHNGWKSLRINAHWPSPSRRAATRQIARGVRIRGLRGNRRVQI